jgi:uncharacterized membrane protein
MRPLHPMHAILLASALPLFVGVWFSDLAYARTFEVQWKNFASWLLVGALAIGFCALVWSLVDLVRLAEDRGARRLAFVAVLLATWIIGFVNALVHAGDAWASMPTGHVLAVIAALLSALSVWLGFSNYRARVAA